MFMRVDKLLIELPMPKKQDPNAGAALQELLGGKYGEMSTLNNYMYQSFNFRSKAKLRAIYDVVASITAEEVGHVELVANGVAMLNNGPDSDETDGTDISDAPFSAMQDIRLAASFLSNGGGAMPVDSNGLPWNGTFVTTTGNVIMDMLFNFHLECGARIHKLRVYETMTEPTGREVCAYLLVPDGSRPRLRAGVEKADRGRRDRADAAGPEHRPRAHSRSATSTWPPAGTAGSTQTVRPTTRRWPASGATARPRPAQATPRGSSRWSEGVPDGGKIPDLNGLASAFTPEYAPEEMFEIAQKLYAASGLIWLCPGRADGQAQKGRLR